MPAFGMRRRTTHHLHAAMSQQELLFTVAGSSSAFCSLELARPLHAPPKTGVVVHCGW
jgi:hypothetical protein